MIRRIIPYHTQAAVVPYDALRTGSGVATCAIGVDARDILGTVVPAVEPDQWL